MARTAKVKVELSDEERKRIEQMLSTGRHLATHVKRAQILRFLDMGRTGVEVAELVGCARTTIAKVRADWKQGGLEQVFTDKPRPGREPKLNAKAQALVVELVATQPPEGCARWTHELLKLKLDELELGQTVSARTIGRVLKKTKSAREP